MKRDVIVGRKYRHFKGYEYLVIDIATHTETGEKLVIYKALYGDGMVFAREVNIFLDQVEDGRKDNITGQKNRFELID